MGVLYLDDGLNGDATIPSIESIRQNANYIFDGTFSQVDPLDPTPLTPSLPLIPRDLTGWQGIIEFRYDNRRPVIYRGTTTNGAVTMSNPTLGIFTIDIPAVDTLNFPPEAWIEYDILLKDLLGKYHRVLEGKAYVNPGIVLDLTV